MPMHYNNMFVFEDKNDYLKAREFLERILKERNNMPHGHDPDISLVANCEDDKLSISFGETCCNSYDGWFQEIPKILAKEFPSASFRSTAWTSMGDYWWAYNKNGTMTFVDHHEEIYEMMWRWHIDVEDPFAGPSKENWAELKRCREQYVQEMIDLGVDIVPGTWPPTDEQLDQEYRLRYDDSEPSEDDDLPF